jgi:hypothetical protein
MGWVVSFIHTLSVKSKILKILLKLTEELAKAPDERDERKMALNLRKIVKRVPGNQVTVLPRLEKDFAQFTRCSLTKHERVPT